MRFASQRLRAVTRAVLTIAVVAAVFAMLDFLAGCNRPMATIPPASPLGAHLAPAWIGSATRVQAGTYTVYYRGTAVAGLGSTSAAWGGTITGDVLLLSKTQAMVCPSGTVTISPAGAVSINGPHHWNLAPSGPLPWQNLLPQGTSGP